MGDLFSILLRLNSRNRIFWVLVKVVAHTVVPRSFLPLPSVQYVV